MTMFEDLCIRGFFLAYLGIGIYMIWSRQTIPGTILVTAVFLAGMKFVYPLFMSAAPILAVILFVLLILYAIV